MAKGSLILATSDGGCTWKEKHDTKTPHKVYGVQLLNKSQGWYTTGEGLFTTHNGGATWDKVLDVSFLYGRFQFVDEHHGWIRLYPNELKATQDGGKTWVKVQNPCEQSGLFSFIDPNSGWMVCATGGGAGIETKTLFRTADSGRTWTRIADTGPLGGPQGKMPLSSYAMDLFFLDSQHGWLSTAKGDLLVTTDGGTTWEAFADLGDLARISDVQFLTDSKGYAVATEVTNTVSSRLLATADGGKTWTQVYESTQKK